MWNDFLNQAKQDFPNPLDDPRRLQKGRAYRTKREPLSDDEIIKKTIAWVGGQTQSHQLARKASAPERVMNRAMQYHAAETAVRMAKYGTPKSDPRGMMLTFAVILITCGCLGVVLVAYVS